MKKFFLILLAFVLLACSSSERTLLDSTTTPSITPTKTGTPTRIPKATMTPSRTPTPCPPSGESMTKGNITIFFEEGVSPKDCDFFSLYLGKYAEWAQIADVETGPVEVYVMADVENLVDTQYRLAKERGCNPDLRERIFSDWVDRPGAQAQGTFRAAFYWVQGDEWKKSEKHLKIESIVHEVTRIVQMNYAGSCPKYWSFLPNWYQVGQAQWLSTNLTFEWALKRNPLYFHDCRANLGTLELGNNCAYFLGEHAFVLLAHDFPDANSFDLLEKISNGSSFSTAFYETYGISAAEFFERFDNYRKNEYSFKTLTPIPAEVLTTTPTP